MLVLGGGSQGGCPAGDLGTGGLKTVLMPPLSLLAVERRRRDKINNWIVQLSKIIPDCSMENTKSGQVGDPSSPSPWGAAG